MKLTRRRWRLLAAIADGAVTGEASHWWCGWQKVTGRVGEAQLAGWVVDAIPPPAAKVFAELTDAGREAVQLGWTTWPGNCRDAGGGV